MDVRLWFGLFAPAKTPKPIIAKLNREIGDILRDPVAQETFLKQRGLWRQGLSKGEASALIGEALRKGSVPR